MAMTNVNPTRMELTRLKNQLVITRRGHKLLKDKQDEMIRQFMGIIETTKNVREEIEKQLTVATRSFEMSKTMMSSFEVFEALQIPAVDAVLNTKTKSVMNVNVPELSVTFSKPLIVHNVANTPYEFDNAIQIMKNLMSGFVQLAELDRTCELLSLEIEKTRRRVNAIEYVMIPEQVEIIKSIRMKLADAEMSNTIRVMKSKEIVVKKLLLNKQK